MRNRKAAERQPTGFGPSVVFSVIVGAATLIGCAGGTGGMGGATGEGPGHRAQYLALTAEQELSLGRQAYREVLEKYRGHIVRDGRQAEAVRNVGNKIVQAAQIKPLQHEVNLRFDNSKMEWEFTLIDDKQTNAFCLPGGKVAVFTGLFRVLENDDELAAVLGHEIGHALAHHASERVAREHQLRQSLDVADNGTLTSLSPTERSAIMSSLAPGTGIGGLAFDRAQESEADHIGVFLMTFAGYKPEAAIRLWENMAQAGGSRGVPEILSDHPSDARRIAQMRAWVPLAEAGLKAYKEGRIAQ